MQIAEHTKTLLTLAGIGAAITLGKLLSEGEPMNLKRVAGRVIVGSGLSMIASAIVAIYPNLPIEGVCGVSAALAIFGVHFLEDLVKSKFGIPVSGDSK
jgi:hypothetical protein